MLGAGLGRNGNPGACCSAAMLQPCRSPVDRSSLFLKLSASHSLDPLCWSRSHGNRGAGAAAAPWGPGQSWRCCLLGLLLFGEGPTAAAAQCSQWRRTEAVTWASSVFECNNCLLVPNRKSFVLLVKQCGRRIEVVEPRGCHGATPWATLRAGAGGSGRKYSAGGPEAGRLGAARQSRWRR